MKDYFAEGLSLFTGPEPGRIAAARRYEAIMKKQALSLTLHGGVARGDAEEVRRALAEGADPDGIPANRYETRRALAKLLLDMSHNNFWNQEGAEAVACVAALLEAGASPNEMPGDEFAPILLAVDLLSPSERCVVELLTRAGADVNVTVSHRGTPLHIAVLNSCTQHVVALLAAGADVNARANVINAVMLAPVDVAIGYNRRRMIPLLLRAGATLDFEPRAAYPRKVYRAGGFKRYEAQMKESLARIFIDKFPAPLPARPLRTIVEFWAHAGDY